MLNRYTELRGLFIMQSIILLFVALFVIYQIPIEADYKTKQKNNKENMKKSLKPKTKIDTNYRNCCCPKKVNSCCNYLK